MTSDPDFDIISATILRRLSVTKQIDILQKILNAAAEAQNYELEYKTVRAFEIIRELNDFHESGNIPQTGNGALFAAWVEWLADWDNYSRNLLFRRRVIGILNKGLGEKKFTLDIYPYTTCLYSLRGNSRFSTINLHESLVFMSEKESRQFASLVVSNKMKDIKQLMKNFMDHDQHYYQVVEHFKACSSHRVPKDNTKGRYYDLESVFQKCNQRNFGGKMPRPKVLHWSARVNHSTMGSYNLKGDSLMVNRGLDRADVPAYVLDFIMYHELLHKALGIKTSGTKRMAHTSEFRKYERAHPDYERAQAFLQKNASKL